MDTEKVAYKGKIQMNEQVSDEKPLVTFALFAYNQEKYIREAVEGALAQTYSPLQIILSDDCSSDQTFAIIQEMVAEHAGPHEVLLNRNEPNLGLADHINYLMTLVKGELIVVAAGDDISLPERTATIVAKWCSNDKTSKSIHSAYIEINTDGKSLQTKQNSNANRFTSVQSCIRNNTHVTGATHAWSKELFTEFGPLRSDVIHEDCAIPLRAMLLGHVSYINTPLVKYRIDVGISSGFGKGDMNDELYGTGAISAARYYVDYLQKSDDLMKFGADKVLQKICNRKLQERWLLKALGNREAHRLKLFVIAIAAGAGVINATNQLAKYYFPNLTVQKRKLASHVRLIFGISRL